MSETPESKPVAAATPAAPKSLPDGGTTMPPIVSPLQYMPYLLGQMPLQYVYPYGPLRPGSGLEQFSPKLTSPLESPNPNARVKSPPDDVSSGTGSPVTTSASAAAMGTLDLVAQASIAAKILGLVPPYGPGPVSSPQTTTSSNSHMPYNPADSMYPYAIVVQPHAGQANASKASGIKGPPPIPGLLPLPYGLPHPICLGHDPSEKRYDASGKPKCEHLWNDAKGMKSESAKSSPKSRDSWADSNNGLALLSSAATEEMDRKSDSSDGKIPVTSPVEMSDSLKPSQLLDLVKAELSQNIASLHDPVTTMPRFTLASSESQLLCTSLTNNQSIPSPVITKPTGKKKSSKKSKTSSGSELKLILSKPLKSNISDPDPPKLHSHSEGTVVWSNVVQRVSTTASTSTHKTSPLVGGTIDEINEYIKTLYEENIRACMREKKMREKRCKFRGQKGKNRPVKDVSSASSSIGSLDIPDDAPLDSPDSFEMDESFEDIEGSMVSESYTSSTSMDQLTSLVMAEDGKAPEIQPMDLTTKVSSSSAEPSPDLVAEQLAEEEVQAATEQLVTEQQPVSEVVQSEPPPVVIPRPAAHESTLYVAPTGNTGMVKAETGVGDSLLDPMVHVPVASISMPKDIARTSYAFVPGTAAVPQAAYTASVAVTQASYTASIAVTQPSYTATVAASHESYMIPEACQSFTVAETPTIGHPPMVPKIEDVTQQLLYGAPTQEIKVEEPAAAVDSAPADAVSLFDTVSVGKGEGNSVKVESVIFKNVEIIRVELLVCTVCKGKFLNKLYIKQHLEATDSCKAQSGKSMKHSVYYCPHCYEYFEAMKTCRAHQLAVCLKQAGLKLRELNSKQFQCQMCEKKYFDHIVLQRHLCSYHMCDTGLSKKLVEQWFPSEFRKSMFESLNSERKEKPPRRDRRKSESGDSPKAPSNKHKKDQIYECHMCHMKFSRAPILAIHMKICELESEPATAADVSKLASGTADGYLRSETVAAAPIEQVKEEIVMDTQINHASDISISTSDPSTSVAPVPIVDQTAIAPVPIPVPTTVASIEHIVKREDSPVQQQPTTPAQQPPDVNQPCEAEITDISQNWVNVEVHSQQEIKETIELSELKAVELQDDRPQRISTPDSYHGYVDSPGPKSLATLMPLVLDHRQDGGSKNSWSESQIESSSSREQRGNNLPHHSPTFEKVKVEFVKDNFPVCDVDRVTCTEVRDAEEAKWLKTEHLKTKPSEPPMDDNSSVMSLSLLSITESEMNECEETQASQIMERKNELHMLGLDRDSDLSYNALRREKNHATMAFVSNFVDELSPKGKNSKRSNASSGSRKRKRPPSNDEGNKKSRDTPKKTKKSNGTAGKKKKVKQQTFLPVKLPIAPSCTLDPEVSLMLKSLSLPFPIGCLRVRLTKWVPGSDN